MSKIEWTQKTWNPIVGCSVVSPGCTNCYAMRMADRLESMGPRADGSGSHHLLHYAGTTTRTRHDKPVWTGKVALAPEHVLTEPLRRRKPTTYFVNSMGDLFHEDVPVEWIERVFAVMALCPQHTFQVLTKRSGLMMDFINHADEGDTLEDIARHAAVLAGSPCAAGAVDDAGWPLPNVWLGVSAERQQEADARIPDLLATPAAVRFVSAEPLLGPLDLHKWLLYGVCNKCGQFVVGTKKRGGGIEHYDCNYLATPCTNLDWIIVGGESGPGARPMHPDWARSIRDQCVSAGVPFFFKQWGEWAPSSAWPIRGKYTGGGIFLKPNGHYGCQGDWWDGNAAALDKLGKARAGRLLDGCIWDEMPAAAQREEVPA